jgi:hypothetical protein
MALCTTVIGLPGLIIVLLWMPSAFAMGDLWRRKDVGYVGFLFWTCTILIPLVGPITYSTMRSSPRRGGAVVLACVFGGTAWKFLLPVLGALSSLFWIRTPTTNVDVVGPYMGEMWIEYEYSVDGRKHRAERYSFIPPEEYLNEAELMAIQGHREEYPVCYVAPWDHATAVLVRQPSLRAFTWRFPWLVFALGLYLARRRAVRLISA